MKKQILSIIICLFLTNAKAQFLQIDNSETLTSGNVEANITETGTAPEEDDAIALELEEVSDIKNTFTMYPNPTRDVFTIKSTLSTINKIELIDINGRIVKKVNANQVSQTQVNISNLIMGLYFVRVETTKGTSIKKIIKS
ncbi:T9SS type A sorting domain-containing protein [Flavobacterium sp. '19STA2R22 D10 B1']|uniref:T9SS type A sorting domain-containing protein n=1 Tax=Flavobacterium aerium TaxID=3037261 RepID=UPI00278C0DC4|nr:T9SS type A sorting domain-containing protein [Flavobacterium sp. '19STA2R22 D10 B1']